MSAFALLTAHPQAWGLTAGALFVAGRLQRPGRTAVAMNLLAAGLGLVGLLGELAAGGWLGRAAS